MHKFSYKTLFIIFFFLLIGVVVLLRFFVIKPNPAAAGWWNDSWNYRKIINIENTNDNQSNVFITLSLDTSDSSRFQDDCGDIRFTDESHTLLNYYLVSDCGTKNTSLHVNFPILTKGTNTFYLYYGNPSIENAFSPTDFSTPAASSTSSLNSEEKFSFKKIKIPSAHSKEVSEKYTVSGNTFVRQAKDNPKDKIEVEVGDIDKPDSFVPKVKLKRWDDEVNLSVKLIDNETDDPVVSTDKEKIKWTKNKREVNFYELPPSTDFPEGGYEFEITLKEKPATNKVEFNLETKGLEFFYQPPLTQQEKDKGMNRPDNIIGSYAVYYKNVPLNIVGGKEYRTGKAFHIYRPRVQDANGAWVWGVLNIDETNGLLTVTIPQEFLDNAVYPVTHAAGLTLGYTTVPGTAILVGINQIRAHKVTAPTNLTISSLSVSDRNYAWATFFKGVIFLDSDKSIISNGVGDSTAETGTWGVQHWNNLNYSSYPTMSIGTTYWLGAIGNGDWNYWIDSAAGYTMGEDNSNSYANPIAITDIGTSTNPGWALGIYATYISNITQSAFRWRNDNGNETTATWKAAENTVINNVPINSSNLRLRFSLKNDDIGSTFNFKLQIAPKGGAANCNTVASSSFSDVPTTAGTALAVMTTSPNFADQASTTNQLSNPGGTFAAGKMVEFSSNQASSISVLNNYFTETEYNFQLTNNATPNTSYCFRTFNNVNAIFDTGITNPTGVGSSSPRGITSADFNNDGLIDLATANEMSNNITVLLKNSNGAFNVGVTYSVGSSQPFSITSTDLNSDGNKDIITGNLVNNNITVFLGNGNGTFAIGTTYPNGSGNNLKSVTSADLNGDLRPDIITADAQTRMMTVFLNYYGVGSSTLSIATTYPTGGSWPNSVTAADLNGDRKLDIVTSNENGNNISVFLNYFGVGSSTFSVATTFPTVADTPLSVTTADFNGDGRFDIATANYANTLTDSVTVFLNYYGVGSSTLSIGVTYPTTGLGPFSVTAADFNGDDKPDLATANQNDDSIDVFTNKFGVGSSTFTTGTKYSTIGDRPSSIISADFNGDGKPDLTTANQGSPYNITLFYNSSPIIDTYSQVAELKTSNGIGSFLLKGLKLKGLIFK